jgi:TIR domain
MDRNARPTEGQVGVSRIFISYRSLGDEFAAALIYDGLCEELGKESVFLASRSIPAGSPFQEVLWRELRACQALLAVIGPDWLSVSEGSRRLLDNPKDFVRREIAMALDMNRRVIPVLLGNTPMPKKEQLPKKIARLAEQQWLQLNVRTAPSDIAHLVEELKAMLE